MNAPKPKYDWTNPPVADEDPVLQDVQTQMEGAQISDSITLYGHKYELHTLWPREETWADARVGGVNFYQAGRGRRLPYIAAALDSVDGKPLSALFKLPKDTPEDMREAFEKNPRLLEDWRRTQLYNRLIGDPPLLQPNALEQLWGFYQTLEARREAVMEKLNPLSTGTGDSASSPTSSPVKAS